MRSLVIYATRSGNTRRVAEEIARVLGQHGAAQLVPAADGPSVVSHDVDLVVVGGPTEGHGATPAALAAVERLAPEGIAGVRVAAFDTRLTWPRWLSGSAASKLAEALDRLGARLVAPPESFLVTRAPELLEGELERAGVWAERLAGIVDPGFEVVASDGTTRSAPRERTPVG